MSLKTRYILCLIGNIISLIVLFIISVFPPEATLYIFGAMMIIEAFIFPAEYVAWGVYDTRDGSTVASGKEIATSSVVTFLIFLGIGMGCFYAAEHLTEFWKNIITAIGLGLYAIFTMWFNPAFVINKINPVGKWFWFMIPIMILGSGVLYGFQFVNYGNMVIDITSFAWLALFVLDIVFMKRIVGR